MGEWGTRGIKQLTTIHQQLSTNNYPPTTNHQQLSTNNYPPTTNH
ncbi:hypothetical protein [Tolypothrix sp. VBCCA 56010]